jgi:hypothetical protein
MFQLSNSKCQAVLSTLKFKLTTSNKKQATTAPNLTANTTRTYNRHRTIATTPANMKPDKKTRRARARRLSVHSRVHPTTTRKAPCIPVHPETRSVVKHAAATKAALPRNCVTTKIRSARPDRHPRRLHCQRGAEPLLLANHVSHLHCGVDTNDVDAAGHMATHTDTRSGADRAVAMWSTSVVTEAEAEAEGLACLAGMALVPYRTVASAETERKRLRKSTTQSNKRRKTRRFNEKSATSASTPGRRCKARKSVAATVLPPQPQQQQPAATRLATGGGDGDGTHHHSTGTHHHITAITANVGTKRHHGFNDRPCTPPQPNTLDLRLVDEGEATDETTDDGDTSHLPSHHPGAAVKEPDALDVDLLEMLASSTMSTDDEAEVIDVSPSSMLMHTLQGPHSPPPAPAPTPARFGASSGDHVPCARCNRLYPLSALLYGQFCMSNTCK